MKKIACIGNFDGVHLGHQLLISRVVELADDKFIPTVITFDPDPETIFTGKNRKYLTTLKQKKEYLYNYGIKEIIVIPFTKEVSYISKNKFIELFLNNFNLDTLVCGEDFRFGHRGEGSSDYLIKTNTKNFKVEVLEHVLYNHEKISSTLISNLIKEGNIKLAERLLNHDYIIEATILNKEVITENVIPLQGEFNVSINHEKSILKENLIDHPNKKDVSIIFI
ncbi:MAG: FAD synthetase family protein [Bacillota bacterium]|nr:FAD synthetase family protein [Bacillota bacterium]NLL25845.1 FAD synthetase family protein [Erysipelotrichia bacterium]